jgi:hypothetical protein
MKFVPLFQFGSLRILQRQLAPRYSCVRRSHNQGRRLSQATGKTEDHWRTTAFEARFSSALASAAVALETERVETSPAHFSNTTIRAEPGAVAYLPPLTSRGKGWSSDMNKEPSSVAYSSGSLSKSVSDEKSPGTFKSSFPGDVGRLLTVRWDNLRDEDEPEEITVERLTNTDFLSRDRQKDAYRSSAVVTRGGQTYLASQRRSSNHRNISK